MKRMPAVLLLLLPLLLYSGTLAQYPLWWPGEYRFAAALWEKYPWCSTVFLVRLPAALTALAMAGLLAAAGKKLGMRHPAIAGWSYLLLPWTFVWGRAASPLILIAAPFAAAALAEMVIFQHKKGVGLSGIAVFSAAPYFFGFRSGYLALLTASVPLSLIAALYMEAWAKRGNGKKADIIAAAALWILGGGLLLYEAGAALQKYHPFPPFSFPVDASAAAVLLLPCLWLWIARQEQENLFKKLFFSACAAGTLLTALPGMIPARVRRDHAPGEMIRRLVSDWRKGPLQLYEAESCRGLLCWELKQKAMPLSQVKLSAEKNTVIVLPERKNAVSQTPEVICHTGNCYLYCYSATRGEL